MSAAAAGPTEDWRGFFAHPAYVGFASAIQDQDRTRGELEALVALARLGPGSRVLDLGCGFGRISVPLAARGCAVTGLDASAPLLGHARTAAADAGVEVSFRHEDLRALADRERYDAVLSLGTAFGYADDEDGDAAALVAVARALVPGGVLVLDTENREPKLRMATTVSFATGPATVRCTRGYDHLSGRWSEHLSWDGGEARYSLRLYSAAELRRLLEAAGLVVDGLWGALDGTPFDADTPRMVLRASRP